MNRFMNRFGIFAVVASLGFLNTDCLADVNIAVIAGSGSLSDVSTDIVGDQREIEFTVSGTGVVTFRVRATSGTELIRHIKVKLNTGVTIGKLVVDQSSGSISYIREISLQSGGSSTADFWLKTVNIDGDLGGPGTAKSGSCDVNYIESVVCGGDITADIHLTDFPSGSASEHKIVLMQCDGDFFGDITVDEGRIETLTVGGNIGSATVTPTIAANNFIQKITADEIWANIDCGETPGSAADGVIWRINANTGSINGRIRAGTTLRNDESVDRIECEGDMNADIIVFGDLKGPIWVHGDLFGDITVGGSTIESASDFSIRGRIAIDGIMDTGSTISIGKDLNASITVKNDEDGNGKGDPAGAVLGQVILNADNNSFKWLMNVHIGEVSGVPDIKLDPDGTQPDDAPFYERLSAEIGGGAIGLVPFEVHGADSDPVNGYYTIGQDPLSSVRIRHYGPIRIANPLTTLCVKIERRASPNTLPPGVGWNDVSSSYVPDDISVSSSNNRDLLIVATFNCAYEYRITPVAGELLCDSVPGDVDVAGYIYTFEIEYCPLP